MILLSGSKAVNSCPVDSILGRFLRPQILKRFGVGVGPLLLNGKWRKSVRFQLPAVLILARDKQQLNIRASQVFEPRAIVQIPAVPLRPWIIGQSRISVALTL